MGVLSSKVVEETVQLTNTNLITTIDETNVDNVRDTAKITSKIVKKISVQIFEFIPNYSYIYFDNFSLFLTQIMKLTSKLLPAYSQFRVFFIQ